MSDSSDEKQTEEPVSTKHELYLDFDIAMAQSVAPGYATNIAIQRTDYEYILSFFEVLPPLIIGTPKEVEIQLGTLRHAPTRCVARIVIARGRVKEIADLLQRAVADDPLMNGEG